MGLRPATISRLIQAAILSRDYMDGKIGKADARVRTNEVLDRVEQDLARGKKEKPEPTGLDDYARLAHSNDPGTSKEAAAAIFPFLGELQKWVLDLVVKYPDRTGKELAKLAHCDDPYDVKRRLSELKRDDVVRVVDVRKCRVTGKRAEVFRRSTVIN